MSRRIRILLLAVLVAAAGTLAYLRWDDKRANDELARRYDCPTDLTGPLPSSGAPGLESDRFALLETAQVEQATSISFRPSDGVAFITARQGTVHRLAPDHTLEQVLDLSADVSVEGEQGLLGTALSPDESTLYLDYTDAEGHSRVVAVALDAEGNPVDDPRDVLAVEQPHRWHNAGGLEVDEAGDLYVTLGDGGGQADPWEHGQDKETPLGSILRITPTPGEGDGYEVPDDNPFVGDDDADPRIWAYGLRNPWRIALDGDTLWISDAGDGCFEEIDTLPASEAGANFGWDHVEGPWAIDDEPTDHRPPVFTYSRTEGACAVIGGFVYRGAALPDLDGTYLFADHCRGEIMALDPDTFEAEPLGVAAPTVTAFGKGADGEPWVLTLAGAVYRLVPAG